MKLLLAGAILFLSSSLLAADDSVRIEIKSSWNGMGSSQGTVTITGGNGKYFARGRQVDAKAVELLLAAMKEPFVRQPSLQLCGITQEWLLANYIPALEEQAYDKIKHLSPQQVELFKSHFTNEQTADAAFLDLFKHWHTDDYPDVSVSVSQDGKEFSVQSKSQFPFMLPWLASGGTEGGYNCGLSQALAGVLPKKFANRERLELGRSFRWALASQIMDGVRPQWDMLDTEFKIGPTVAPIFANYTPLESAISNLSSVDLNGLEAWNAKLRSKDLLPNLIIGVSLRYKDKRVLGVQRFLQAAPVYANLVLSVPRLSRYLAQDPERTIELRYVDGSSLSAKAENNLIEDLQKHGKADVATKVAKTAAESAFLEIGDGTGCWVRGVVFPSREFMVWHFDRRCKSVLGFDTGLFQTWDFAGQRSTGTLIDESGKMM